MKPKDYPHSVLEEKVNSTEVSIVGVSHDYDFLCDYKQFLEEKITESDAIMIEGTSGKFEGLPGEEEEVYTWQYDSFFGPISNIAHSQKKRVYQADPSTPTSFAMDMGQALFGAYTACVTSFNSLYALPIGVYLFSGSLIGTILRYLPLTFSQHKQGKKFLNVRNSYEWLLYGDTDHRNLKIAEGIDKVCSKVKDVKKLACFHGDAHSKPIRVYLKNPLLRRIKKTLYLPTYRLVEESKVREFTPTGKGWKLTRKI